MGSKTPNPIPYEEVDVEPVLELQTLNPAIEIGPFDKVFAVDKDGAVFFCDSRNHRILKYDIRGRFLQEIGGLGQGTEDLYWPYGIVLSGEEIVVLNAAGREIKTFDKNGKCISRFEMPGAQGSKSLVASDRSVVTDMRYQDEGRLRKQDLLAAFSLDGKALHHFGRLLSSNSAGAQLAFNTTRLGMSGTSIFGAYYVYPAIFGYRIDGTELFFRHLSVLNIPEFEAILRDQKQDLDPAKPNYQNRSLNLTFLCANILARSESIFYYVLNHYPYIIIFDGNGFPIRRLHIRLSHHSIRIRSFTLGPGDTVYGVIQAVGKDGPGPMLVKAKIAERLAGK